MRHGFRIDQTRRSQPLLELVLEPALVRVRQPMRRMLRIRKLAGRDLEGATGTGSTRRSSG